MIAGVIDFRVFGAVKVLCRLYARQCHRLLRHSGHGGRLMLRKSSSAELRTFFPAECAAQHKIMFGPPVRQVSPEGEVSFTVSVTAPLMGIQLVCEQSGIVCDWAVQPRFSLLQAQILSELVQERALFKNPPSVESLAAITPNWGFVTVGGKGTLSPYTIVLFDADKSRYPCMIDLQLSRIEISRTTIRPTFTMIYVGPKVPTAVIDFEWPGGRRGSADELEEVSDVPNATEDGIVTLIDPAMKEREKAAAKAVVRAAFAASAEARARAEEFAEDFHAKYDLSDSESAFSEWLSEDEDD